jgi:hypothetical protein
MEDTLRKRNTYAFVNYSQDVSTETYLARVKGSKPKGLPQGAKFIAATLVNIPGSVKVNLVGCAPGAKATATDAMGGILDGCLEGDEESAMLANLKTSLENFEEDNPFGWLLGRNRNKFGFPEETSTLIWNFFVNRGSIEEEVRIELAWRLHQVAGAIWENGGLANVLNKIEKGEVPTWKTGAKALDEITTIQRAEMKANDANKMSAILLEEFAYGKGPKQTDFAQTDAFTKELNKDDVLLKEAIGKFYREMLDKKFTDEPVFLESYTNGIFQTNYTFSPDHTGTISESWQKHLDAWNNNPIAFVIGGMTVIIKKQSDSFQVVFTNPMGLKSLGLHLLNDHNPNRRDPLATLLQTFTFNLSVNEFKQFK